MYRATKWQWCLKSGIFWKDSEPIRVRFIINWYLVLFCYKKHFIRCFWTLINLKGKVVYIHGFARLQKMRGWRNAKDVTGFQIPLLRRKKQKILPFHWKKMLLGNSSAKKSEKQFKNCRNHIKRSLCFMCTRKWSWERLLLCTKLWYMLRDWLNSSYMQKKVNFCCGLSYKKK